MNETIAWKISQGAHLDPAELQELAAFINRTEGTNAKVGVMATGQGEVTQLSDITPQAGRIYGEFISPKSPEMFDPLSATFTGVVMIANGLTIGGATYNLLGIKAGVVQWGANTTDASFQAGAQAVKLDDAGVTVEVTSTPSDVNAYKFTLSGRTVGGVFGQSLDGGGAYNVVSLSTKQFSGDCTTVVEADTNDGFAASVNVSAAQLSGSTEIGYARVVLTASEATKGKVEFAIKDAGTVATVNENGLDVADTITSDGLTVAGVTDLSGGATTINSSGGDYDTTIKGDNRDVAVVDAGRDTFLVSRINLVGGGTLTISGGVVTATHSRHTLAPESGTADDLDTINGYADGDVLVLGTTTGNTITLKDETGNLALEGDFVMNAIRDTITLMYRDSPGRWCELARSNNA